MNSSSWILALAGSLLVVATGETRDATTSAELGDYEAPLMPGMVLSIEQGVAPPTARVSLSRTM